MYHYSYSNENLKTLITAIAGDKILNQNFKEENYNLPLVFVTTSENGDANKLIRSYPTPINSDPSPTVNFTTMDTVLATSSIPFIFPPLKQGKHFKLVNNFCIFGYNFINNRKFRI